MAPSVCFMCAEISWCQRGRRDGANCYSDIIKTRVAFKSIKQQPQILLINRFTLVGLKELIKFFFP